jgi:ribosomal protein S27AE
MIRLFQILFKTDLSKLPSAMALFNEQYKQFKLHNTRCPACGTVGRLGYHCDYGRNLVAYEDGAVKPDRVSIKRVWCSSCGRTSAILPDVIVPYKQYSIMFILCVLKAYYFRTETVTALCERFCIAVQTLYGWKKRYLSQKKLDLGALEKYLHDQDPHLKHPEMVCFTDLLYGFFRKFNFSFLQHSKAMAQTTKSGG